LVEYAIESVFSPEELAGPNGISAIKRFLGGGSVGSTEPTAPTEEQLIASNPVVKMRKRADAILKELSNLRSLPRGGGLAEDRGKQRAQAAKELTQEINDIKKALTAIGVTLVFPDVEAKGVDYTQGRGFSTERLNP